VAHTTNTVEHPDLVAWRLMNFARLVGRENVMAGTDCGFSQGVAAGAALATRQLWG
jgi:5-methyltetrahydropteroyltriglutamate--homocysteine methyltransferase